MTEVSTELPVDPISEMHGLIRDIHLGGYQDIDAMRRFMHLYNEYRPEDDVEFFSRLDSPDLDFEFGEGVFDVVVSMYDTHGGSMYDSSFPDVGRNPSDDWGEELKSLAEMFAADHVPFAHSHALYVRQHAKELQAADTNGEMFLPLLANPRFISALARVYDFELFEGRKHLPPEWPDKDDDFVRTVLHAVGFKYVDARTNNWTHRSSMYEFEFETTTLNLRCIAKLESVRPGAVKYLSEQFGIRHFSRYPTEMMAAQFDSRGIVDGPYGIVVNAAYDHNGAFSDSVKPEYSLPGELFIKAAPTHRTLAAEADSAQEFEDRIKYFDSMNSDRYLIDFAMVEAHANAECLAFGTESVLGILAVHEELRSLRGVFSDRACFTLVGCKSGRRNGIGQSISRKLDTVVIAPMEDSGAKELRFKSGTKHIMIVPLYYEIESGSMYDVEPVVYIKGKQFSRRKAARFLDNKDDIDWTGISLRSTSKLIQQLISSQDY
jgi:hypothetical protein